MRHSSFDPGSRRPLRRAVMWIGIFSLLLSLVMPLVQLHEANAANQDGQDCEPGFVFDEASGECVEEQPEQQECDAGFVYDEQYGGCVPEQPECGDGEIYDPNIAECVPDPSQQQDDPVGVQVEKYDCPAESGFSFDELLSMCSSNENSVQMTHGSDVAGESTNPTTNYTEWVDEPAGSHYVYEDIPEGYGQPIVYCGVYVPGQSEPSPNEMNVQNGNAIGSDLAPGEYLYCWWFNIQEDGGFGIINIYKYSCDDYQGDPQSASYDELADACQTPLENVTFELYQNQQMIGSGSTNDAGEASFDEVPAGDVSVAEILPTGYQFGVLFCAYHPSDEGNSVTPESVNLQDGFFFDWTMEADFVLECVWFNFPEEGEGPSHIRFEKYWCPAGLAFVQAPTQDDLIAACQETGPSDTTFSLEGPDGPYDEQQGDGSPGASGTWEDLPPGDYTLTEDIPDDAYFLQVFCHLEPVEQNGDANGSAEPQEWDVVDGNSIQWTAAPGYIWVCVIFNFPLEDDHNWIDFYKYECAFDTPTDQDADYYQQECQPVEGWDFDVQWDGGGSTQQTDGSGLASWSGAPIGEWTGSETVPEGYGQPIVYCRYVEWPDEAGYDNNWFPYDPSGGEISFEFEYDNVRIECYWFNFPTEDEYNWIDFYKYACPFDAPTDADIDYYQENCEPVEGWEFDLQYDGGGGPQSTDDNGFTGWSGVPMGEWTGSETVPEGYGQPIVWCRYLEWPDDADEDGSWFRNEAPDGVYEGNLEYDQVRIECYWFNFEPEDNYNWIDFYKYDCVFDTPTDQDPEYYQQNCQPREGWEFDVQWDGGGGTQTTNAEGFTGWSGVPTGDWTGSETVPEGYGQPIVYCRYVEWPDEAGFDNNWFPYDPSDGEISFSFEYDNLRIECYWFNFPPEDGGSWIEVYKYFCPEGTSYDTDPATLATECSLAPDVAFTVTSGNYSQQQTTSQDGYATWSGVPIGQWFMAETLPEGYGDPVVYCRYTEWPDTATDIDDSTFAITFEVNQVSGEFQYDGMRLVCGIFNFPVEGGTLTLYKYWCEGGDPYHEWTFEDFQDSCTDPSPDVEFTGANNGLVVPLTTDDNGQVQWTGIPIGSWGVTETIPDGYGDPIVYCRWIEWPDDVEVSEEYEPYSVSSGFFVADFQYAPMQLECYVFNIPFEQNWIDITKWWCSEDVTIPYEQSADNLLEECERYADGAEFNLEYTGGSEPMTTDGEGNAEWAGLPIGPWSMHETIPDGYGDPVVYCRWIEWPEGADFTNDPFKYEAPAGSFSGEFELSGMRLHCDIFNIPDYDPGWITVYKWYCAVGVPVDSSPEYLRDTCDLVTTGVNFSLEYGETSVPMTTDTEGKAEWTGVPTGGWELHETSSASSYGDPVIHCQWVDWPPEADAEITTELYMPEAQNASISGSHDYPGMRLVCYWFNFGYEGGDSWITIYKYRCLPNSSYEEEVLTYLSECTETMDGASFTLTNDQGAYPDVSDGGTVQWTGLQDGTFSIQEEIPTGYNEPKVWCTSYPYVADAPPDGENLIYDLVDATGGLWEGTISDGPVRIICYWFNIPGEDNTVTVYKYNCEYEPVGFNSLGEWLDACPTKGDGVGFTLTNSDGPEHKETTDGKAEWTDVSLGEFSLTEDIYPGYGEPVIWCGWTAYYEGAVYDAFPMNVPAPGGVYEGDITIPGTTWFCFWFNIPDDQSRITVYKYNCPQDILIENSLPGYQEACTEHGDGIEFTLENMNGSSAQEITDGSATWNDVPQGDFTLSETIPFGYGEPLWWCSFTGYQDGAIFDGFAQLYEAPGGVLSSSIDYEVTYFSCWVFNFPDYGREVTVYKWYCPEGLAPESEDFQDWQDTCTEPMHGVSFNLSNDSGSYGKNTNVGGKASWYGVEPGGNTLFEQYLPGYEPPIVYCSLEAFFEDGAAYAEGYMPYDVSDNSVSRDLDYAEYKWICHFFNIPKGPGEITIYKWYCPPGYNVDAWAADPKTDCTQAQDGVMYTLDKPVGPNVIANTGESIPGGVYFGELDPGTYVVTEMVPSDVAYVFIWDCTGGDIPKVHPTPLTWGNVLNVDVAGGDSIVCNWYNVPDPEDGWLTVYKYQCWTTTYTSEVDCDTYEFGASFELFQVDGNVSQGVGETNAGGTYTWNNLEEGAYSLDELSHTACKITSTKVDDSGNALVDAGEGTVVKVYNCQSDSSTTPVPGGKVPTTPGGKVPTKYPNTGIEPDGPVALAQDGEETEPADEQPDSGTPTAEEAAQEFYQIACLNQDEEDQGRAPATATADDAPVDDGGLPPFLQPTEDAEDPESTPEATEAATDEAVECERGSVPERMVIDAASVDHEVEILEIIDGVMQAPTGPNVVTWYKETARLGESNNMVFAAHVNWWNVPEGPFFHLQDLEEGDRIEITGEDGMIYVYEVQWVRQESNLEAPDPEVVGPTDEQSLTLITCGGEWDASISEYNERTVARAIQVDVIPAEEPVQSQEAWVYPLAA